MVCRASSMLSVSSSEARIAISTFASAVCSGSESGADGSPRVPPDGREAVADTDTAAAGDDGRARIDSTRDPFGARLVGEPQDVRQGRDDPLTDAHRLGEGARDRAGPRDQPQNLTHDVDKAGDELAARIVWPTTRNAKKSAAVPRRAP